MTPWDVASSNAAGVDYDKLIGRFMAGILFFFLLFYMVDNPVDVNKFCLKYCFLVFNVHFSHKFCTSVEISKNEKRSKNEK